MESSKSTKITVSETVNLPLEKVWKYWTDPADIMQWNHASDDWHTTRAENDLRHGGKFLSRMEARDGSAGFDFSGVYDDVKLNERIGYTMDDGRKAVVTFTELGSRTVVTETFEAEFIHSPELQRSGWQAILTNFKRYAESRSGA